MNLHEKFVDWGWTAFCALAGLVGAFIYDTRKKLDAHELNVANNYVKKDTLVEMEKRIIERMDLVVELLQSNKRK